MLVSHPSELAGVASAARVAMVCDRKVFELKCIKILISKQMPLRIPIALVQVKAGNTNQNLLNKIRKIIYSLHQKKKLLELCITI